MRCTNCNVYIDQFDIEHPNNNPRWAQYKYNPNRRITYCICNDCAYPRNFKEYVKSLYNLIQMHQYDMIQALNKTLKAERDAANLQVKELSRLVQNHEELKTQVQARNKILSYFVSDQIVESMKTFTTYIEDLRKQKLNLQDMVNRSLTELIDEMNQRTNELIETQTDKITYYLKCQQQNKSSAILQAEALGQKLKHYYSTAKIETAHNQTELQALREVNRNSRDREKIYSEAFVNRMADIFASEIKELTKDEGMISSLRIEGERLADKLRNSALRRGKLQSSAITELTQLQLPG